jgi:hypothetical protein
MKKIIYLFIFFVLTSPAQSFAGRDGYICTILQVQALHSSGSFNTLDSYLIGKSFSIDRNTGEVVGKPFEHKSHKEIRVLDRGSEKDSYKHIVISNPPNIWAQYVYVREFTNSLEKPFWGTDNGEKIFSGVCK